MQWLIRGLGLAFLGLSLVALTGCSSENEASINSQMAKSDASKVEKPVTPQTDPREWGKQAGQGTQGGYPGAKGQPKSDPPK